MNLNRMYKTFTVGAVMLGVSAFVQVNHSSEPKIKMPYKKMGLTQEQAAAHLLSRFTFGATPGEIGAVVKMGLDKWLQQELGASLPDDEVNKRLAGYRTLAMDNDSIVNTYLNPGQVIRVAIRKNIISKDSVQSAGKKEYQEQLRTLMQQAGYRPIQELQRELINQKVIRAAYGGNQLKEILTDFWFNHFNVSLTKNQCEQFILTYERDAIRPNVLGNFENMLVATAKHPAMLEYLDNASSVSNNNELIKKQENNARQLRTRQQLRKQTNNDTSGDGMMRIMEQAVNAQKKQGLNENYAREIMELHTLGVDGGYTQKDVTEVARALTGWSPAPLFNDGVARRIVNQVGEDRLIKQGFVREGDFFFRANRHDEGEKNILGKTFPANGGYKEGMEVLHMLATHPSTAKFIAAKLATRFVADTPSTELVNRMAEVFLQTKGNIKALMITMVNSPEFWDTKALREKVKSPFELAISAIRATNADVQQPFQIYTWCMKMGQRFYYYQAPTGFPDRAGYWINTGSLLNRMNFGLAFATEKIPGIKLNLVALNNNREPESAEAALAVYSKILLPERNQEENIRRLTALARDVNAEKKINDAAAQSGAIAADSNMSTDNNMMMNETPVKGKGKRGKKANQNPNAGEKAALGKKSSNFTLAYVPGNNAVVSQVAGIIIGSPEFQRK